jgi:hypothetical protein
MSSDSRWTGGAANRQWQSGTRPREEWASEEAPPKTGFQSSVRPAETHVSAGRTEDGFPVVGFPAVGKPAVGKPVAMKKTGKENVVKKTGKENVSLSGNGRIIAGKLRDAGAADVGEREIQAIEREYTPRATGPVPGYLARLRRRPGPRLPHRLPRRLSHPQPALPPDPRGRAEDDPAPRPGPGQPDPP